MVPFRKLGCGFLFAFYSNYSRICTVCEIFIVKEWCDFENRVRVRSRSLEMTPFDRSHTSSYSPSIATIIIIMIIIITDLYSAFRSEDTEALDAAQED